MTTRNTPLLQEIIGVLQPADSDIALMALEEFYRNDLLVNAGNIQTVANMAEQLRLDISTDECSTVLNHIGSEALAAITLDTVEEVINDLFPDRFIEP